MPNNKFPLRGVTKIYIHNMLKGFDCLARTSREDAEIAWCRSAEFLLLEVQEVGSAGEYARVRDMLDMYEAELGITHAEAPTSAMYTTAFQNILTQNNMNMALDVYPPASAEKLLYFLLPRNQRAPLIGDLKEEFFAIIVPKFGIRDARVWYWAQVLSSLWPILSRRLMKLAGLAWLGKAASWLFNRLGT